MQQSLLINFGEIFGNLYESMGFVQGDWQNYVMLLISFVLMYLAIVKKFEPMLLLPIAFGMFLITRERKLPWQGKAVSIASMPLHPRMKRGREVEN